MQIFNAFGKENIIVIIVEMNQKKLSSMSLESFFIDVFTIKLLNLERIGCISRNWE